MTEKFTIKDIKEALEKRQGVYRGLSGALDQEANLARAESNSALSILEGKIAGFVAQQIPHIGAPLLWQFDSIAQDNQHPQRPLALRDALIKKTETAKREQAELEGQHGTAETLAASKKQLSSTLASTELTRTSINDSHTASCATLRMLDILNISLECMNAKRITPQTISQYDRPQGWFARVWRYITDAPYREARPVLDGYAKEGIDLVKGMNERNEQRVALDAATLEQQGLSAKLAHTEQAERAINQAKKAQLSDREIVNQVRTATTSMILSDQKIFWAVDKAFPGELDAETKAMHTRMQLFGQLATNIGQQRREMEDVAGNLTKPVSGLTKAVRNGNGSKKVAFDLDGKIDKLDKHQLIMSQRVAAAKDIRSTSHSYTALSSNNQSSNDSTNWLLWYLILSDSGPAHAAPTSSFNSGMGGDYGGGGASGDFGKADNSYFKAELLGVTPENAASFGIDAKSLSIPADIASDLGSSSTASDFNSLGGGDDTRGVGLAAVALGSSLDLGNIGSDISSLSSELSSSNLGGGYSSSGYSSGGYSYDGGGYSGGGDSGGGGGGGGDGGGGGGGGD